MLDRHRYAFILAYGRSGSTILSKLLNAHEGVLIRGENLNIPFRLMQAAAAAEDMRAFGAEGRADSADRPWFGNRAGDPAAFARALAEAFVAHVLKPGPETRLTGFKEIRNTGLHMRDAEFERYLDLLLRVFPDARILLNSRDAEAVIRSGWWAEQPEAKARAAVLAADARFAAAAAARPGRVMHLWHERTIADPAARAEILRFVGQEPDEARMQAALRRPLTHARGHADGRRAAETPPASVDRHGGRE